MINALMFCSLTISLLSLLLCLSLGVETEGDLMPLCATGNICCIYCNYRDLPLLLLRCCAVVEVRALLLTCASLNILIFII